MSTLAPRLVSVLGLAFGDCGKGLYIDYLCRRLGAHTVVRFNGGGQAAHNVVLPDGRHHTFSQFGAATFSPGVATVLASPVVLHPGALMVENDYLRRAGIDDALSRLVIDGRCRITTPFHQAAGRLRELRRGEHAHGSCAVGVGETVAHSLIAPDEVLSYSDLSNASLALNKLDTIRRRLYREFGEAGHDPAEQEEVRILGDAALAVRWLAHIAPLIASVAASPRDRIAEHLNRPGTVLFEGAQGILLDEWRGFHPHTTWSSTGTAAVEEVAREAGLAGHIEHLGVLRTYMTRHGHGPFPTADAALLAVESHNEDNRWQGPFRIGHPDTVLLRYALAVAGPIDGLLVTHLDKIGPSFSPRWATSYEAPFEVDDHSLCRRRRGLVDTLVPTSGHDLAHQQRLARLLDAARPRYAEGTIGSASQFVKELESIAARPVLCGSFGPTHATVERFRSDY